jgi:hypothetical protein
MEGEGMTDGPPTVVVEPQRGVVSVATGAVDALRGTPMLLVMVLLNCAFIAAAAYYLRGQQDNAYRLVDKIFDRCLPGGARPQEHQSLNGPPARPFTPPPGYPGHWGMSPIGYYRFAKGRKNGEPPK